MISHITRLIKKIFGNQQIIRTLLLLLTIQSIAVVCIFALFHNPHIDFDESNTIRIAQQDNETISRVLSYEQNFPLYYRILHVLFSFTDSSRSAVFFNLAFWLFSTVVFYKLVRLYEKDTVWALFSTLLYTLTSSLSTYAYYVRVYSLINFFVLIFLCAISLYQRNQKKRWLFLQAFSTTALSLLHPSAIFILPLTAIVGGIVIRKRLHIMFFFLHFAVACVLSLLQFLQKQDIVKIYLTGGVEYMNSFRNTFYTIPAQILFSLHETTQYTFIPLFYIFLVFTLYLAFRNKFFSQRIYAPITVFIIFFLISHLILPPRMNPHHFIFLCPPLLLFLTIAVHRFTNQYRTYFLFFLCLIFVTFTIFNNAQYIRFESGNQELCKKISRLNSGTFITDYALVNAITYCHLRKESDIIALGKDSLLHTEGKTLQEILIYQAKSGGTLTLNMRPPGKNIGTFYLLENYLRDKKNSHKTIYYVKGIQSVPYLLPDELLAFHGYELNTFMPPSIFVFETK